MCEKLVQLDDNVLNSFAVKHIHTYTMAAAAASSSRPETGLPAYHQVPETKYERKNP
jgi:hypothetical protein